MKTAFSTLYIYVSNLGLFAINLFKSVLKTVLLLFGKLFKKGKKKETASSTAKKRNIKGLVIKASVLAVLAVIVFAAVMTFFGNSKQTAAYLVTLDGEEVGYTETAAEAEYAAALVMNETGNTSPVKLETTETKTDACNITDTETVFAEVMKRAFPEYQKVCEIYTGTKLLCTVNDMSAAKKALDEYLEKSKKEYPNASVSFSKEVTFKYAYRKISDEDIWSADTFALSLKTLEPVSVQHVECEKEYSSVDYDTVEIETNKLFIGDSRVRREGKDGSEYVISLVTYNGGKKVLSQHLTSLVVTPPVSKIVERGMRAQSLSIGSYTVTQTSGYFCWPVVGLYNVTSNYGYRSLGYHRGIDISGASASGSLVVAGASGTVTEAGWSTGGYGNYVIIDHGNEIETLYGHMLDNSIMVSKGDTVTKGQAIGRVGNTGYSFGAHLHFEVRINGNRINPAAYLGLE